MSITTKKGDFGVTDLLYGGRVWKDHRIMETVGDIDELRAVIGLTMKNSIVLDRSVLQQVQRDLSAMMGEIACSDRKKYQKEFPYLKQESLDFLEKKCSNLEEDYGPFKDWEEPASHLDWAVRVCRRAERTLVTLTRWEHENFTKLSDIIPENSTPDLNYLRHNIKIRVLFSTYLNRLSDMLWLMARAEVKCLYEMSKEKFEGLEEDYIKVWYQHNVGGIPTEHKHGNPLNRRTYLLKAENGKLLQENDQRSTSDDNSGNG